MSDAQTPTVLDAVVAGHLCLDLHPHFRNAPGLSVGELLQPGKLITMGPMTFSTGGTVSNTGLAMNTFGCAMAYVAKVGDDTIGSITIDAFRRYGLVDGIKQAKGEHSSYSVVLSPQGIDRMFLHFPGTNDTFVSTDIDYSILDGARLFHFGYPTLMDATHANDGEELCRIFAQAKARGVTTSLDISFPDPISPGGQADWPAIYRRALPHVDVFCPSIEEAFFTLDPEGYAERQAAHPGEDLLDHLLPDDYSRIASAFLSLGCAIVGLKAGRHGWYMKAAPEARLAAMGPLTPARPQDWADLELWSPAFHVDRIAGATGAGDCSIAGFLTALLKGLPPARCLKAAGCAGWMNLRAADALSGLGTWEEMARIIPTLSVDEIPFLAETDWRWDEGVGLWRR